MMDPGVPAHARATPTGARPRTSPGSMWPHSREWRAARQRFHGRITIAHNKAFQRLSRSRTAERNRPSIRSGLKMVKKATREWACDMHGALAAGDILWQDPDWSTAALGRARAVSASSGVMRGSRARHLEQMIGNRGIDATC